jgi:hypothetical protein
MTRAKIVLPMFMLYPPKRSPGGIRRKGPFPFQIDTKENGPLSLENIGLYENHSGFNRTVVIDYRDSIIGCGFAQ